VTKQALEHSDIIDLSNEETQKCFTAEQWQEICEVATGLPSVNDNLINILKPFEKVSTLHYSLLNIY